MRTLSSSDACRMSTLTSEVALDQSNVRVSFVVRWFGLFTIRGTFTRLTGWLRLSADNDPADGISVTVDPDSVDTGVKLRDHHLVRDRFFDAANYGAMTFRSTKLSTQQHDVMVEGVVVVHGREQLRQFRCSVPHSTSGAKHVPCVATLAISRRYFGIGTPGGIAGWNPLLLAIADRVDVTIEADVPVTMLQATRLLDLVR